MSSQPLYQPTYANSWALVIGINAYPKCPLNYACNDAEAVAQTFINRCRFPADHVTVLKDSAATKDKIMAAFLGYAQDPRVTPDDRILMFFAGHGYTRPGRRGEVGYLVPVDGSADDLATLIRWDELTRNADLICAKHVLFVMDACYGGLALTRSLGPGQMRFLRDMLSRYSRQVLTAVKADEVVADAGGPRAGHSVFTGHFLDGIEGAAGSDGIITANGLMAYVYDRVARDHYSRQTPHYGFIDGDGDLILTMPDAIVSDLDPTKDKDVLVSVPATLAEQPQPSSSLARPTDALKDYLSEPRHRIKLDNLVRQETQKVLFQIGIDQCPVHTRTPTAKEFAERLKAYEVIVCQLQAFAALLGRWADSSQRPALEMIFERLAEVNNDMSGMTLWLGLRWYPTMLLMYSAGIAALSARDYSNLASVLTIHVAAGGRTSEPRPLILPSVEGLLDVQRTDVFKTLPGHERQYVPRSEYFLKVTQPILEDTLFLGRSYERLFDRFEVFLALVYADVDNRSGQVWGPVGRFAWKYNTWGGPHNNPLIELKEEADRAGDEWGPLRAGLFAGSHARFKAIIESYEQAIKQLGWS